MPSSRLRQVETLFHQVLEVPADRRTGEVDRLCGRDDNLRAEVLSLLEHETPPPGFLAEPAMGPAFSVDIEKGGCEECPQGDIGPYRIERRVASGGMGTVYRASRVDGQFEQTVAIKVVKRGMDSDEVLKRFYQERRTLAALQHPNIARLLDGGSVTDGRPYLVMEYVDGVPIDEYCNAHRLTTPQRLRLFGQVCQAVSFAHQSLVVHRDLKPNNILVATDGTPKLLDFGIAKVIHETGSADTTVDHQRRYTLEYSSPEQIDGLPPTTATDVYSLGVILYELLTGHRPHRYETKTLGEIVRVVRTVTPLPPSAAVLQVAEHSTKSQGSFEVVTPESVSQVRDGTPERLWRRLRGDLDTIALKAMHQEPARRYASAEQLALDIDRHLKGLPVNARPDTFSYRAKKFLARNKATSSAGAIAIFILLAAIAATTWQRNQAVANLKRAVEAEALASAEAKQARAKAQTAEQVSDFLVEIFSVADPSESRSNTITAREVLDRGADHVDRSLQGQSDVCSALKNTMGLAYFGLGLHDRAAELFASSLDLRRAPSLAGSLDVAESLHNLAMALHAKGDYQASEQRYRDALEIRRQKLPTNAPSLAQTLNGLGSLLVAQGRLEEGESLFREALRFQRQRSASQHAVLASTLHNLGRLSHDLGKLSEAEELLREALELRRRLLGRDHVETARTLNALAGVLLQRGDLRSAEECVVEYLAAARKFFAGDHEDVARALHNLAFVMHAGKRFEAAEPVYREAIEMRRKLSGQGHAELTYSLLGLGGLYMDRDEPVRAEPLFREAVQISREAFPEGHWMTASFEGALGQCLTAQRRFEDAEPYLLHSLSVLRTTLGQANAHTQGALQRLADLYRDWGKPEEEASYRTTNLDSTGVNPP